MDVPSQPSKGTTLADDIVEQVASMLQECRVSNQPLEVDPWRSRLFELFVTADGAGFLHEEAEHDLTADTLCRRLAERWGLDVAAQQSVAQQSRLDPDQLARLRVLWAFLRLWMEWTYAWQRWPEFHRADP